MVDNKIYGLLGISAKAGKVISGTDIVLENLAKGKIYLVIVAEDASEKTKKNIKYFCEKENVDMIDVNNRAINLTKIGLKKNLK